MKVGIFGGAFDPPHIGHLIVAQFCLEEAGLDKVVFVPTGNAPHKKIETPAHLRKKMVELATEGIAEFEVSDFEIRSEGVSWTYRTVEHFRSLYPEIYLIVGEDEVRSFRTWKNPELILKSVSAVLWYPRTFDTKSTEREIERSFPEHTRKFRKINAPVVQISSTWIRRMVSEGRRIRFLVPPSVETFILSQKLYRK